MPAFADQYRIFLWEQDVNLWKLMGDFNLHGITVPGEKKR